MRNKKLIIAAVVIIAFIGFILVIKGILTAKKGKKPAAVQVKGEVGKPVKKAISKGKGLLTIKVLNSKGKEIPVKIKMFRAINSSSSIYSTSSIGGRSQELLPGTYDLEVDTIPQKIFKNVKVNEGRETVNDLGSVTGALMVKTVNAKKAPVSYPIRILYGKTNEMVTAYMTNKALEIVPGTYDIEIGTTPRQYQKNVRIDSGRESIVDVGCLTGTLTVKTVDENGKEVRCLVKITKADTGESINTIVSNKPAELMKGKYNIEIMSVPRQVKKDVAVNVGEESLFEFTVTMPPVPQRNVAAPVRTPAQKQQNKTKR